MGAARFRRSVQISLLCLLAGVTATAHGEEEREPAPLDETERAHHLLNRFTLGATPALMREVRRRGIDAWIEAQLAGEAGDDSRLTRRLAGLKSVGLTNREIMEKYVVSLAADATPAARRRRQQLRNVPRNELKDSVLLHAVLGRDQVREAAADFFRNHLCVSVDKGAVRYLATEYEREVIRAGALGKFGDMLRASAKHPAMLVYLDNAVSRRPATKAELKKVEMRVRSTTKSKQRGQEASDIAAQRGLNENYARELLELHTLGVDNYYTQADVENLAATLTGWTVESDKTKPLTFRFRQSMHVRGDKRFLRHSVRGNKKDPVAEGERALDILDAHDGTARFLAWKLCRHLVVDDPPDDLVDRIAKAFKASEGDLPTVYRAIIDDPEFFARRNYLAKFKRPFEFVVSALRVTNAEISNTQDVQRALIAMNEPLYQCKDPTGFYDQAEAWRDAGAFAVRWKFAMDLAGGKLRGVRIPDALYEGLPPKYPELWKDALIARLLPVPVGRRTNLIIDKMVARHLDANPEGPPRGMAQVIVGAILGSPEFQKQ